MAVELSRAGGKTGAWNAPDDALPDLTFRYKLLGTSGAPTEKTAANTYTVRSECKNENYSVVGYEYGEGGDQYTVGKATLTVTENDHAITYGEAPAGNGVTYSGFVNGESANVLKGTLAYAYGYEQYGAVGEYGITPQGLVSDNYAFDYREGKLTVNTREIEVTWGGESYTYTGSAFALPNATAEGVHGDRFTLVVSQGFEGGFLNAGEYSFTAAFDGTDAKTKNYTLKSETAAHSYTVEKQTVTAPAIASKVYNGEKQTADVADTPLYTVTENNGGTDAGSYDVKLTLRHPENYKWTEGAAELVLSFTIAKATYDLSGVTFEDLTVYYDAAEHSIYIKGALPSGVEVTYSGNGQKAAGEYTVTANFTGDGKNYDPIPSKQAILKILAISHDLSEVSFEDARVKYDGEAHSIYIEGTLPHGVSVAYEGNGQTDLDVYTVTALLVICILAAVLTVVVIALAVTFIVTVKRRKAEPVQEAQTPNGAEAPAAVSEETREAPAAVLAEGGVRYNRNFAAKLIQSGDEVKSWYIALKNELLSYRKVKARVSWKRESFRLGRTLAARFGYRGNTLCIYLSLDPALYAGSKYKVEDVSRYASCADSPCMYRLKNAWRARYAVDLIAAWMSSRDVPRTERKAEEYDLSYESTEALIEKGLIKVIQSTPTESISKEAAATEIPERVDAGEVSSEETPAEEPTDAGEPATSPETSA